MENITSTIQIKAPLERTFDVFSDIPRAAEYVEAIQRIEMLTEGSISEGTRWRETRTILNREVTEELEITRFDPPRSYTVEAESRGTRYSSEFRFNQEGDQTRVELLFSAQPVTFMARAMSPLGKAMQGQVKKMLEEDLKDLKREVESRPAQ